MKLAKSNKYQIMYSNINLFKFSKKWIDCFMIRHNFSNHYKIIVSQHLPENLLEK